MLNTFLRIIEGRLVFLVEQEQPRRLHPRGPYRPRQNTQAELDHATDSQVKGDIRQQLINARRIAGLTQSQLALRLGVSRNQVGQMERQGNQAHNLNTLRRYVAALGEGFSVEVVIRTPREGSSTRQ